MNSGSGLKQVSLKGNCLGAAPQEAATEFTAEGDENEKAQNEM
jgi:hypothetical protein